MISNILKVIFFITLILVFSSCVNKAKETEQVSADTTVQEIQEEMHVVKVKPGFPDSGENAEAFIPLGYIIDMEADGDLNGDSLVDKVMILIEKEDSIFERPVIVLFKKIDGEYTNTGVSWTAVGPKYTVDLFKIYEYEEVTIDTYRTLVIWMSGVGASGNLKSHYSYENGTLYLTFMETYNMGAGSHQGVEYDMKRLLITQTIVNTMKEDMPEVSETISYSFPQIKFEDADPDSIIKEVLKTATFKLGY